jgi:hypothetical protein
VRQYITAGREDEQVPDRSTFKRVFLNGIEGDADLTKDGYVTGSELGMYLSDKVVNYTRRAQHPQYGKINNPSLDRGDFVFVPLIGARQVSPALPSTVKEKPPEPKPPSAPPITQAKKSPVKHSPGSSEHLAVLSAPSFPPKGTRFSYRVERSGESRTEEYVVLGEGVYDDKKVHQVRLEGKKEGLILYDLKTGNWMRTVVDGSTVGNAKPYEDIFRYPLSVGKKHQGEFYYFDYVMSGKMKANVEVQSLEEVRVPAGTFMVYQIVAVEVPDFIGGSMTSGINAHMMGSRQKKLWYSPDLKIVIKMEDRDNRNSVTTRTELLEYSEP